MADDPTPEDRLELALERIAKRVDAPRPETADLGLRLDRIISTLRDALGK